MKKKTFLLLILLSLILCEQQISQPIYPPNGDTGTPVNFTFVWQEAYASHYILQVSYEPDFANVILEADVLVPLYELQTNLAYCTLHYWHYKVFPLIGGSYWSSVYNFTTTCLTSLNKSGSKVPDKFVLHQNYPNPFNPSTKIKYDIPERGFTVITVYDEIGREISVLVKQELLAGTYNVTFDGSNLPSGIYFYKITLGDYSAIKKMVLMK